MNDNSYTTPTVGAYGLAIGFVALLGVGIYTVLMPELADDAPASDQSDNVGAETTSAPTHVQNAP